MKKRVGDEKLIIIGVAARGINDVHLSHLINITYIHTYIHLINSGWHLLRPSCYWKFMVYMYTYISNSYQQPSKQEHIV